MSSIKVDGTMADTHIHIPGEEPKLEVGLFVAARELQKVIDLTEDPELQAELIEHALEIVGTSEKMLGGKNVFVHAHEAYTINPVEQPHVHNINVQERQYGEMLIKAYFNGIAHFEAIGSVAVKSLCMDVSSVEVVRDRDLDYYSPGEKLPGTLVLPVRTVESVIAAA